MTFRHLADCSLKSDSCFHGFLQVTSLEEGESYVFRVSAVNAVGVGRPSQLSEPVCAKALPGNKPTDVSVVVSQFGSHTYTYKYTWYLMM